MALYRVSIQFPADSALPKDVITINPHFAGDAPQALADALKTNLAAVVAIGTKPFVIKVYDALKAPPSYPLAVASQGTGFFPTGVPREVAICLSYYAAFNRPHTRGRLYLPAFLLTGGLGVRPTSGQITAALNFRSVFTSGLPAGHKWNTYSPTTGGSEPVTNVWVDDEWDTVRSRGMKGVAREMATVGP
jgi:hypothetical protein